MNRILTYQTLVNQLPPRASDSHKGTYGRLLLIGGTAELGGAIILATEAALAAGAGLLTVATDPCNHAALHARVPEAMVCDWTNSARVAQLITQSDGIVIGPGLGQDALAHKLWDAVYHSVTDRQQLIVDGDALTLLAQQPQPTSLPPHTVLTPHQIEWQRLSGLPLTAQHPTSNRQQQQRWAADVVLKKHGTELYLQDGTAWTIDVGTPAMATGGTGDTLAGCLASLLVQFPQHRSLAIQSAVYAHSHIATQLAQTAWVVRPTQLCAQLPAYLKQLIG